jgi:hypothetical protein
MIKKCKICGSIRNRSEMVFLGGETFAHAYHVGVAEMAAEVAEIKSQEESGVQS